MVEFKMVKIISFGISKEYKVYNEGIKESDRPRKAKSKAVSFPIPEFAPVIKTTFPSNRAVDRHTPPAAYFLHRH